MDNKELLKIAKEAKSKSYCPYSKFKVGSLPTDEKRKNIHRCKY